MTVKPLAVNAGGFGPSPSFFIYDDLAVNTTEVLQECKQGTVREWRLTYYTQVEVTFARQLERHPWRVFNPENATWFVIPFSIALSRSFECPSTTHAQRVKAALDTIEASKYFQRRAGLDHFWVCMHWIFAAHPGNSLYHGIYPMRWQFFPHDRRKNFRNMVIGRISRWYSSHPNSTLLGTPKKILAAYANTPRNQSIAMSFPSGGSLRGDHSIEDWRCTLNLPVISSPHVWRPDEEFQTWLQHRQNIVYFRDRPKRCSAKQHIRDIALSLADDVPLSILTTGYVSREAHRDEMHSSRFCLIFQCDADPQVSRFVDALSAACIPVIINDGFLFATAPFVRNLNYHAFSVVIPESEWLANPSGTLNVLYELSQRRVERLYKELLRYRQALLWTHPQSRTLDWVLAGMDECLYDE